jgi:hypothetical protein
MPLEASPANDLDVASATGAQRAPGMPPDIASAQGLYQVVQETAAGPRFLTSFDSVESAMENARVMNASTGNAFKTIMWASDRPIVRRNRLYRGDNVLPSLIYHPAAVKGASYGIPVSAVYGNRAQVVFTTTGEAVPVAMPQFGLAGLGSGPVAERQVSLAEAVDAAQKLANQRRSRILVRAGRRRSPLWIVKPQLQDLQGLGEYGLGTVITPVTPAEFEELVKLT